jgi:triacylglycerol lipase
MNPNDVYTRLRALGRDFTPAQILATREILAPLASRPANEHLVGRDLQYGPDPRQRLDLFVPPRASATLVFMHGGGFVRGDKGDADAPFYNNVAAWALAQGFAAVNMTYRLAPLHAWPTGAQELALVLDWLADELPRHGVRSARVVLMGQSAGAAHVAGYLAGHGLPASRSPGIAGAVLVSGIYDIALAGASEMHIAYFGEDTRVYPQRSTVEVLASTGVPCLFTVSEMDPPLFQHQAAAAVAARVAATGAWPAFAWLCGHNHLSSVLQLGSLIDNLGPNLRRFVDSLP